MGTDKNYSQTTIPFGFTGRFLGEPCSCSYHDKPENDLMYCVMLHYYALYANKKEGWTCGDEGLETNNTCFLGMRFIV